MDSQRRLALVTGASAGLGEAFAHAYAKRGLDVALTARRKERLEALAATLQQRYGVDAYVIPADLSLWEAHVPILEAVAALAPEAFDRDLGNSYPSVRATLAHMLGAEWIWLSRWNGVSLAYTSFPVRAGRRRAGISIACFIDGDRAGGFAVAGSV